MVNGFILLHRKLKDWEWYTDPIVSRLFIHCLLQANHKEKRYKGTTVPEGSFLTSHDLLAKELGLSRQNIRTAISKLKSTNELTIKSTKLGTHIFILKWEQYQPKPKEPNQDSNQQSNIHTNQILTTNNNDNKITSNNNTERGNSNDFKSSIYDKYD